MHNSHDPRVLPVRDGVRPSCVVLPTTGEALARACAAQSAACSSVLCTDVGHAQLALRDAGEGRADAVVPGPVAAVGRLPWRLTLDYLCHRLPAVSREDWLRRMEQGSVVDELGRCVRPHTPMLYGLRIYYYREVPQEPCVPFEADVLYQDAHLVVADKPHFLPVVPAGRYLHNTLLVQLQKRLGLPELSPVHRIDRDTAGLVLLSVRRQDRGAYQALFRARDVDKTYEAIAPYRSDLVFPRRHASRLEPSGDFIRMHEVSGDGDSPQPNSLTLMELLEHNARWGRYRLRPVSGKRHQLRVHMAALGLGIVGDGLYPVVNDAPPGDFSRPLRLLAQSLAFDDPVSGRPMHFTSRRSLGDLPTSG